tara:strand:+ start:150 stop:308 length:159 start_codon:yes stop_codon:yes gene_type:complete
MNKAVDSLGKDGIQLRSSDASIEDLKKYDSIRKSLESQKNNFEETDKDVLKL